MEPKDQDIELIDGYLLGRLDEAAIASFEKRLSEDEAFRQLFEEMQIIAAGIQRSSRNELLDQLKAVEAEITSGEGHSEATYNVISINRDKKEDTRRIWAPLAIAASVALLVGLVWFNNPFGSSPDQLASLYEPISPDLIFNSVRSEGVTVDELKKEVSELLFNKKYDESIILLDQIIEQGDDTIENVIRTYGNTIIQIKDCKSGPGKLSTLDNKIESAALRGIVAIDEILLMRKCKANRSEVEAKLSDINPLELLEYDQFRLEQLQSEYNN